MTATALLPLLGLVVTTIAGGVAQRATGMGFALLIAPFLVLALGPVEGILVTNVLGVLSSSVNLALMGRDVDWPRAAVLAPMGLVGVLPGALAVRTLPPAPLTVAVSAQLQFIVLGLASLAAKWALPTLSGLEWVVLLVALAAGIALGSWVAPRIRPEDGMRIVMVLALTGALLALGRGLVQLL